MIIPLVSKYFKKYELECPCCGIMKVSQETIKRLDLLRDMYGSPIVVNSGYRCVRHNHMIGGSPTTHHTACKDGYSHAFDIKCIDSESRYILMKFAISLGFKVIGVYTHHLHISDYGSTKKVYHGTYNTPKN